MKANVLSYPRYLFDPQQSSTKNNYRHILGYISHNCSKLKFRFLPHPNCMAMHLNSCSSSSYSSSTSFTHSSFKNGTHLSSRLIIVPRKQHSSIWVSPIRPRIRARKHFQLKSSNGHPLNAVSLQDGSVFGFSIEFYYPIFFFVLNCQLISFLAFVVFRYVIRFSVSHFLVLFYVREMRMHKPKGFVLCLLNLFQIVS